jgi:hypothetical protein
MASKEQLDAIRSGDLLAFSWQGSLMPELIEFATHGPYAHVSIAWVKHGRVYSLEAWPGAGVRLRPLESALPGYWYKYPFIDWSDKIEAYAFKSLGEPYSDWDCLAALFDLEPIQKNATMCSAYVTDVYNRFVAARGQGTQIALKGITPTKLVSTVCKNNADLILIPK